MSLTPKQLRDLANRKEIANQKEADIEAKERRNQPKKMAKLITDLYLDNKTHQYVTYSEMINLIGIYKHINFSNIFKKGDIIYSIESRPNMYKGTMGSICFWENDIIENYIEIIDSEQIDSSSPFHG